MFGSRIQAKDRGLRTVQRICVSDKYRFNSSSGIWWMSDSVEFDFTFALKTVAHHVFTWGRPTAEHGVAYWTVLGCLACSQYRCRPIASHLNLSNPRYRASPLFYAHTELLFLLATRARPFLASRSKAVSGNTIWPKPQVCASSRAAAAVSPPGQCASTGG